MEHKNKKEHSDDSDESLSYYKNISLLESQASSSSSRDNIKYKPLPKLSKDQNLKSPLQYKLKETNTLQTKSSLTKIEVTPREYQQFSDEIHKLKQVILNLNIQAEIKANENTYKEGKVKDLEKACIKNRRKIKDMKIIVKRHEEKIIQIESRLGALESSSYRQIEKKNYASQIAIGKKVLANIGIRSQKTMGPHLTNSPKIKSNLCSIQASSPKIKKGGK